MVPDTAEEEQPGNIVGDTGDAAPETDAGVLPEAGQEDEPMPGNELTTDSDTEVDASEGNIVPDNGEPEQH